MQLDAKALADATAAIVKSHVAQATAPLMKRIEALEARPAPERGEKGEPGERGLPGSDGVGLAGALIDRSGVLVLTLTDGSTRELGVVVGKDGEAANLEAISAEIDEKVTKAVAALPPLPTVELPAVSALEMPRGVAKCLIGKDGDLIVAYSDGATESLGRVVGQDADMLALEKQLREMVDAIPRPMDGKDGRDGFGLDDFDCVPVDERTIALKFTHGEVCHSYELEFPVVIDRGVYKEDQTYVRGDAVTWGGSLWIAQKETSAKPDSPESGFRLAVKKGRDGKDAK